MKKMKHIKDYFLFEASQDLDPIQKEFLDRCTDGRWSMNPRGAIDVKGSFDCSNEGIKDFMGIIFGTVDGDFYCSYNSLTSLEGAPATVGGNFYCGKNPLTSVLGKPMSIGGKFYT